MSSVSATDRSNYTDDARAARDDYEQKETELVKKQKKEIQRLQKSHDAEVAKIQQNFGSEIEDLRNKNHELLTQRDVDNQNKISQLRSMYLDQIQKKSEEANNRETNAEKSFQTDIEKEKSIHEQQNLSLQRNIEDNEKTHEAQFADYQTQAQQSLKKSLDQRTQNMNKKLDTEIHAVSEDRDRTVTNLRNEADNQKSYYTHELDGQQRSARNERQRLEEAYLTNMRTQAQQAGDTIKTRDVALSEEKTGLQEKYKRALEEKLSYLDKAHAQLEDQVDSRLDHELNSTRSELAQVRSEKIQDSSKAQRMNNLETSHIKRQYEDRFQALNDQQEGLREKVNENANSKIGEATSRNDTLLQETNRRNKMQQNMTSIQHKEDRAQLEEIHKNEVEFLQDRTDKRVRKIVADTDANIMTQDKHQAESMEVLKNNYIDNVAKQREAQSDEVKNLRIRMEEQLRQAQNKAQQKLEESNNTFQTKIADITDTHQKELQRLTDAYSQKFNAQEKSHRLDTESINQQNQVRMAQVEDGHLKEMDRLEKKHQEQIAELTRQIAYFKKKA